MQKDPAVYLLIRSMTASEKAYFKKYSFKKQNDNAEVYKRIFDILDKQEVYSLDEILENKKISTAIKKSIHVSLNSLNKRILASLLEYRKGKSSHSQMFEAFLEYELYKEKKLFQLAEKKIEKAEKIADKHKLYFMKPQLIYWQFHFLRGNISINKDKLNKKSEDLKNSVEEIQLLAESEIISLKLETIVHANKGIIIKNDKDKKEVLILKKQLEKLLLKLHHNVQLYAVLSNNLFIMSVMVGKMSDINDLSVNFIKHYNENVANIDSSGTKFDNLVFLKNLAVVQAHFNNQNMFLACASLIETETEKIKDDAIQDRMRSNVVYVKTLNSALNTSEEVSEDILKNAINIFNNEIKDKIYYFEFLLPISILLIRKKQYKEALEITSEMINNGYNNRGRDIYLSIRMQRAIAWLKLENLQMFDSEISAIYQYFLRNNSFYFKIQILNFIKNLSKVDSIVKKQKVVKNLAQELEKIEQQGTGAEMLKAIELNTILKLGL